MALFVERVGWEPHEETGEPVFRIVLRAETEGDVPNMTADVVWGRKAVRLTEAAKEDVVPAPQREGE